MKYLLINPPWDFGGSVYFGCKEPHLPLEYGYAKALLEREGHEVLLIDGHLENLSLEEITKRAGHFGPHFTVILTAPSYLFWRCPPPELRVPQRMMRDLHKIGGVTVAVGPHASTTPHAVIKKLSVDAAILGECEEVLPRLTGDWKEVSSLCYKDNDEIICQGFSHASDLAALPPIKWPDAYVQRHRHHHHRFDVLPKGPGAEIEASRGCPYHCSFCAKEHFRTHYRKRPLTTVLLELDRLIGQGVEYFYFVDELFTPDKALLKSLRGREISFGIQTRIDLWDPPLLEMLGAAGCVSIEVGVESISKEGRKGYNKISPLSDEEITERLLYAKQHVRFVQANLLYSKEDSPEEIEAWRQNLLGKGVWANKPVPLFPYPGSPEYSKRWGIPDDYAWERAHTYYLKVYDKFSDIQAEKPLPLSRLELSPQVFQQPRRILLTADTIGGVWTYACELARALSEREIEIALATMGEPLSKKQFDEIRKIPHLRVFESGYKLEWMEAPWKDIERARQWLLKLEAYIVPDVVHLNQYAFGALPWKSPVLMVGHSCVLSWWEAVKGGQIPHIWTRYSREVTEGLASADMVVAPSHAMLDALQKHYGTLRNTRVIYNGRTHRHFSPGRKETLVFTAGRLWDEAKNVSALAQISAQLPWPVYMAGQSHHPQGARPPHTRVKSLGQLTPLALSGWLGRASIFALPALYEPFGLSVLEAGLSGCALVLGDIPSLRELWDNAALFVNPGDADQLRDALTRLISDTSLRNELSSAARKRALNFSIEKMVQGYLDAYSELMQMKRAQPAVAAAPMRTVQLKTTS